MPRCLMVEFPDQLLSRAARLCDVTRHSLPIMRTWRSRRPSRWVLELSRYARSVGVGSSICELVGHGG